MAAARTKPTLIGVTLREYLGKAGLGRLSVSSDIAKRWSELVGSGIAAHSAPQELKAGRLTVIVDSSAWMNQLSLLSTDIITKLNKGMGEGTVTELRFRIGKPSPATTARTRKTAAKPAPRRKLTADELAEIERAASAIPDPELRAGAKRMMAAAASAKKRP